MAALAALAATFTACSDNDDSSASNGATKSLKGGTRMKVYTDVEKTWTNEKVYGDSTNADVVFSPDGFTQAKYNSQAGFFTGFIYRQGSVDEAKGGIGAGKMGARTYQLVNGKLTETGKNIVTSFGNVGMLL